MMAEQQKVDLKSEPREYSNSAMLSRRACRLSVR